MTTFGSLSFSPWPVLGWASWCGLSASCSSEALALAASTFPVGPYSGVLIAVGVPVGALGPVPCVMVLDHRVLAGCLDAKVSGVRASTVGATRAAHARTVDDSSVMAQVTDLHPVGDRPDERLVGPHVGHEPRLSRSCSEPSVAVLGALLAHVEPAAVGVLDDESLESRYLDSVRWVHGGIVATLLSGRTRYTRLYLVRIGWDNSRGEARI